MYEHMSRACICARTYFTFERLSQADRVGGSFLPETGWSWSSEQGRARRGHQMRGLFQLTPANSDAAITRPANQNPGQHQLQSRRPSARRTQTLTTSRLRPRNVAPDIGSSTAAHRPPLHRPLSDVLSAHACSSDEASRHRLSALETNPTLLCHRNLRPPVKRTLCPLLSVRRPGFIYKPCQALFSYNQIVFFYMSLSRRRSGCRNPCICCFARRHIVGRACVRSSNNKRATFNQKRPHCASPDFWAWYVHLRCPGSDIEAAFAPAVV